MEIVVDRDVWWLNLELLPRNPHGHERAPKDEEKYKRRLIKELYIKF